MVDDKRLMTEIEVQKIAEKFLIDKYYESKINFITSELITTNEGQRYQFQGEINMRSRSMFGRFIYPKSVDKYRFKIEMNAQQGQIIGYEII